jgi:hypothetical protein
MDQTIDVKFTMEDWQETSLRDMGDSTLKKAQVKYNYQGDFTGTSECEFLLLYHPNGDASFTAVERIEGEYHQQPFILILTHQGIHEDNIAKGHCYVTASSGSMTNFAAEGCYRADAQTVSLSLVAKRK